MIFGGPVAFAEALGLVEKEVAMPTSLTSAELQQIGGNILRRALFSARVLQAEILSGLKDILNDILIGELDRASARLALSDFVAASNYTPPVGEEETIADVTTESRLNLIVDTNAAQAAGYGNFVTSQDRVLLDNRPCQELYRLGFRKMPRDWPERWEAAGGEFYDDRMIAPKDDEIWQALGDGDGGYDDTLGNPYPPFAFNSGMWVKDVRRKKAIELGVIDEDYEVESQEADFVPEPTADLLSELTEAF